MSLNIVHRLRARELGGRSVRPMHENVCPNATLYDVEPPTSLIKKFSRDGKYLICFSHNQQALHVFKFNGPSGPVGVPQKILPLPSHKVYVTTLSQLQCSGGDSLHSFSHFFTPLYESTLVTDQHTLCKDFCLITEGDTHVIVASSRHSSVVASDRRTYGTNVGLRDYSFHLVELKTGTLCDTRTFPADSINLSLQTGVHMFGNLLGVLSLRYQTVHLFQIKAEGKFVDVHHIGENCYEDDALALACFRDFDAQFGRPSRSAEYDHGEAVDTPVPMETSTAAPPLAPFVAGLKHRVLAFLFRRASATSPQALQAFFSHFKQYESLALWRFQFLSETCLLIKFGCLDGVIGKMNEYLQHTAFFVVYSIPDTRVLNVFENSSAELLSHYENYCEFFHAGSSSASPYVTFSSNNHFAREHLQKQKYAVVHAKNGGHTHAVKRLLWALPCTAQSLSDSPFFDQSIFNYDEKLVSPSDRPKPCVEFPLKFYSRRHKAVRFRINPNVSNRGNPRKRYATYIFHPVYPFALSIQYSTLQLTVLNFHFRYSPELLRVENTGDPRADPRASEVPVNPWRGSEAPVPLQGVDPLRDYVQERSPLLI